MGTNAVEVKPALPANGNTTLLAKIYIVEKTNYLSLTMDTADVNLIDRRYRIIRRSKPP